MAMNRLPTEVLSRIMRFTAEMFESPSDDLRRLRCLRSFCLVCRRWVESAQRLLFSQVTIVRSRDLVSLHRCLTTSTKFGNYVHRLEAGFTPTFPYDSTTSGHIPVAKLIAGCLQQTVQIKDLTFNFYASKYITKLVASRICSLSKLKRLVIQEVPVLHFEGKGIHRGGGVFTSGLVDSEDVADEEAGGVENEGKEEVEGFKPAHLVFLPKSIEELVFYHPAPSLLKAVPRMCANAGVCSPPFQGPGLQSLQLNLTSRNSQGVRQVDQQYANFFSQLSGSLPSNLASFSLHSMPSIANGHLIKVLSAIPLLQNLELVPIDISSDLFSAILPLKQLRSFKLRLDRPHPERSPGDLVQLFQSLGCFISHSQYLHTFQLDSYDFSQVIPPGLADCIIKDLITPPTLQPSTRCSVLRKLELTRVGEVSDEVLEDLCQSAPHLRQLVIDVEADDRPREVNALRNLTQLVSVSLNGFSMKKFPKEKSMKEALARWAGI